MNLGRFRKYTWSFPSLRDDISPPSLILLMAALVLAASMPNRPSGKGDLTSFRARLRTIVITSGSARAWNISSSGSDEIPMGALRVRQM